MDEYQPTEFELFEEKAQDIFEGWLYSMWDDERYIREPAEDEKDICESEGWTKIWVDIVGGWVDSFYSRVYKIAVAKFGKVQAKELDISSHLYREP